MKIDIHNGEVATKDSDTLQKWVEAFPDNKDGIIIATDGNTALPFKFVYSWVIGCHSLFIYDPIDDVLLSFFAEDFNDVGGWLFNRCKKYFNGEYSLILY